MALAELTLACSWLLWNFKDLNNVLVSSSERKPLESLDLSDWAVVEFSGEYRGQKATKLF